MEIVTKGRATELVDRPVFNWCFMGAMGALGLALAVWILVSLPGMSELKRGVMMPALYASAFMGVIGVTTMLLLPIRIHCFENGRVTVRSSYLFGLETSGSQLSGLARVESEMVDGDGPEAYWVYLVNSDGSRRKLRKGALDPELHHHVVRLFQGAVGRQTGGATRNGAPPPRIRTRLSDELAWLNG